MNFHRVNFSPCQRCVGRSVGRSSVGGSGRSVSPSVGPSVGRWVGSVRQSVDGSVSRSVSQSVGRVRRSVVRWDLTCVYCAVFVLAIQLSIRHGGGIRSNQLANISAHKCGIGFVIKVGIMFVIKNQIGLVSKL